MNRQDTFRELFISIVKLRLTSVKQIFTNGNSVKTIRQSNDLIGLGSNCRLKKLTDSNAHNTIKRKYFESAILKYAIYSDFSLSLFVFWVEIFIMYSIRSSTTVELWNRRKAIFMRNSIWRSVRVFKLERRKEISIKDFAWSLM